MGIFMIKNGVIGLFFNMKNDKKMQGNQDIWDDLNFYSYIEGLEHESNKLRQNWASAVLGLIKTWNYRCYYWRKYSFENASSLGKKNTDDESNKT